MNQIEKMNAIEEIKKAGGEILYRFSNFGAEEMMRAAKRGKGVKVLRVAFSSESPVMRVSDGKDLPKGQKYWEVLDHSPENADIKLLQNGGAFLDEHDWEKQIGSTSNATIDEDQKGRADLAFANTPLGKERWELMSGGHRKDVSFGYIHTKKLSQKPGADGIPVCRFAWQCYEITSTAVGADHFGTGVGRSEKTNNGKKRTNHMEVEIEEQEIQNETRITELATGFEKDYPHIVNEIRSAKVSAFAEGMTRRDFIRKVQGIIQKKPTPPNKMARVFDHEIGMTGTDLKEYSFARAMRNVVENKGRLKDCFEADVSEQVQNTSGMKADGFFIPSDVMLGGTRRNYLHRSMHRDMSVGDFSGGGATVGMQMLPPIDLLRNRIVCTRLGATVLAGLRGDVVFPREISPVSPQSVPETGVLNPSDLGLDQLKLTPKRVGVTVRYSKQLMLQSTPDIEALIQRDCMAQMAIKHDALLLNGHGAQNEPVGLLQTIGVNSIVFGGAPTFDQIVAMETALAALNADGGTMAYAMTPACKGIFKTTAVALQGATTVSSRALWEEGNFADGMSDGIVNGRRAASSNQIPNNRVIFGNWEEMLYGMWGGADVVYDPFTKAPSGQIVYTINTWIDAGLRHAQSFCTSADSGAV